MLAKCEKYFLYFTIIMLVTNSLTKYFLGHNHQISFFWCIFISLYFIIPLIIMDITNKYDQSLIKERAIYLPYSMSFAIYILVIYSYIAAHDSQYEDILKTIIVLFLMFIVQAFMQFYIQNRSHITYKKIIFYLLILLILIILSFILYYVVGHNEILYVIKNNGAKEALIFIYEHVKEETIYSFFSLNLIPSMVFAILGLGFEKRNLSK